MKEKFSEIAKFLSYVVVGGLATVVEWVFYWLFANPLSMQYLIATLLAIVISTFSNWLFGRLITFKDAPRGNVFVEIMKVYAASVVGLGLNMLIMWLLHGIANVPDMISKIIATAIVFAYNYLIRQKLIYK